ncbi:MAG: hypothetical protein ACK6BG_04200 [Cyanobacteriota bacterium]|jgi:hypothetical protein
MSPKRLIPALLIGTGVVFFQSHSPAQAAVFDLTSLTSTNASIKTVLDSGITLTVSNSNSTGNNPKTININEHGLCAFAATGTSNIGRCGYGTGGGSNVGVSSFQLAFNKPINFNSFAISDFDNANSPANITSGTIRFSLDNSTFSPITFTGTGTYSLPSLFQGLAANQTIYVQTSAVFANALNTGNFRLNNLNATEVPGPLPILGAGAAFSMTRKFRRLSAKSRS